MPTRGRVDRWADEYDGDGSSAYEIDFELHHKPLAAAAVRAARHVSRGKYSDEERGSRAPFNPNDPSDAQIEAATAPRDPLNNFATWLKVL